MPKLSIAIINYNTCGLLESCIDSLQKIDYEKKEIVLIDQASTDDSVKQVKKLFPNVRVIENQNTGYSGGANKGYDSTDGEYLVIMNPDVTVTKDYFKILIKELEKDHKIGAITGKILKTLPASPPKDFQSIIDTTGLLAFKNRRVVDRGQGFADTGQFEKKEEVFGISGCLALYRREALTDIALPTKSKHAKNGKEVWDYDFFMYKEDIDVSWRLNLRGWKCIYLPEVVAYHERGTTILKRYSNKDVIKHRASVPKLARFYSYKNQRLMQLKNEIAGDLFKDFFTLFIREILIMGFVILREPSTFGSIFSLIRELPSAFRKRRHIQKNRKVTSMRHFLKGCPKDTFEGWN
ncbi:MAG: glycosyltransferase family 2 protein [Candidatus Peregrinibacteria bacterium]|nr:glycosyltransferase family 2 protein [Candidatus Peregrinibacteria bacterium]MDZ4244485.1 glycosyltransferase family 2 protein [Candidatus Gracilibacteria bacterium]